jgi:hypothetical protein
MACLCLAVFVILFVPLARDAGSPAFLDKAGALLDFQIGKLHLPSHRLAAAGAGLCALYSALGLGLVLYSFRKTVSSEIFFFAFWVLSVGLEVLRLGVFSLAADGASATWQILATKALLFARYAGYLSLFASGLYAAGFRNEKLGSAAALILALSFALASAMPVNTGSFSATLELKPGYVDLNNAFALIVSLVTVANFLYAVRSTGEASYRFVALGCAGFLLGHRLLTTQWNPFLMVLGFALLAAGSWLFVSRLHAYYLWQ